MAGYRSMSQECHYQGVNRLRTLLERWVGKSEPMDYEAEMAAFRAEGPARRRESARLLARLLWRWARLQEKRGRDTKPPPPGSDMAFVSEMAFVSPITSRRRGRRELAAAMLQGSHLSDNAALVLVWQLRHRNAGYRESALYALRGSTISSGWAGLLLAVELEHPKPVLRQVAEQALRETNLTDDVIRFVRGGTSPVDSCEYRLPEATP
jgi:hypothetical protein